MTAGPHLLVVDDEAGIRESLSSILQDEGYHVVAVGSAEEALERATGGDFEVVLLDVWLPGIDGLEALSRLQASPHPPAVIMISGHGTIETAVRATKLGAFDFIEKRSEEHTSELQSQSNLVCRLLLEKKKKQYAQAHRQLRHRASPLTRLTHGIT